MTEFAFPAQIPAWINGHRVVLDLARDRYLLDPKATPPASNDKADPLVIAPPVEALWPGPAVGLFGPALAALACLRRISRLLTHHDFRNLVEAVANEPVREVAHLSPLDRLLASYDAGRPFFPEARICRLDAPALCLLLRRHGHDAKLVFGARLEPFAAHCWVQQGHRTVNEPVEVIRRFTAILAV